jgi:hypothetical protein
VNDGPLVGLTSALARLTAQPLPADRDTRDALRRWADEASALCAAAPAADRTLRTVHHFACAGGTLISKCLAAMPNVQLLSEVDPLAPLPVNPAKPRFAPTDMGILLRQSSRGTDDEALLRVFRGELAAVAEDARRKGQRLVLRDHAHSHFCRGDRVPQRPTLRDLVSEVAPVRSVLTVRHPLDSLASLQRNGWLHFSPDTPDEYARRYLAFLAAYRGVPRLRYEDIVRHPSQGLRRLCELLDLRFSPDFETLFPAMRLSGDSGRSRDVIAPTPRRPEAQALAAQAAGSDAWQTLLSDLGYSGEDPFVSEETTI